MQRSIQFKGIMKQCLLLGLLLCSGMSVIGEEVMGGMGTPTDPNTDSGTGGCCDPSALNLAAMLTKPGNFTVQGQAGVDFNIANKGVTRAPILMVAINQQTGAQESGLLFVEPMEEATFPAEMLGDASEFYLISLQRFELTPASATRTEANSVGPHQASTHLNLIEMETEAGGIMTVGVDVRGNCHYPIHGQIIGTYDAMHQRITMHDGRLLNKL